MIPTQPAAQPTFVPGQDPTRVGARRAVAAVIDVALGWILYLVLYAVLARKAPASTYVGRLTNICNGHRLTCTSVGHYYLDGPRRALVQFVGLAYVLGVFALQRGLTGSTLGTRLLGVVTVDQQGEPIGVGPALLRMVAGLVDWFPFCIPGLTGLILIASTSGHRRVGDMAAHSFVVERAHLGSPILVPGLDTGVVAGAAGFEVPPLPPTMPTSPPWETAQTPLSAPADPTQPQWDADRHAYIQWDQIDQRWMQFDQDTQEWRKI